MTACVVVVNVVLVALVYLYFWRVFSRKRAAAASPSASSNPMDHDDDDDDDASSAASTPSSPPSSSQDLQHDLLVASLPTFVARPGSGGAGAECAVCIAELRDGDEGRALPRCGHRFHAACVDAWLRRRHTTCPLCRASVVVAAAAEEEAGPKGSGVSVTDATTAAAPEDMDAPV